MHYVLRMYFMAFFDWDDKYRVGIPSIDLQHQKLFELTSHFYEKLRQKETKGAMSETLQGLVEYAGYHFATEERYMQKYQYPFYARHVAQHSEFVEKVTELQTRFQSGTLVIAIEVADFLKGWLSKHILGEDQKFGPFFQEKGLK
jgi:hemerythrin